MGRLRTKRIGVMGGTFDPIHLGHLAAAQEALDQFGLDEVVFVPAAISPFKQGEEILDPETRYLMAVIATASHPQLKVSRFEVDRPGPSYTVDTMRALKKTYGARGELYFIGGSDTLLDLSGWKDPEGLLELCVFIAIERPGHTVKAGRKFASHPRVTRMAMPGLDISSTDIRQRVKERRSIRYLVPREVAGFIEKNGLYR